LPITVAPARPRPKGSVRALRSHRPAHRPPASTRPGSLLDSFPLALSIVAFAY